MQFKQYTQNLADLQLRTVQIAAAKMEDENNILQQIFGFLDLTTLEATDNSTKIKAFCEKAISFSSALNGVHVAAVCVYMPFVAQCREMLKESDIVVATVACSFPSGQIPLDLKLEEVRWAVSQGAQEIDMVISRGSMLAHKYADIFNEVQKVKEACGDVLLKVILETGELKDPQLIRKASELSLLAGADFLKTSTGKIQPAATPEAALVMLDTIQEFYVATGKKVGFKPAGGIADPETAILYYKLVQQTLGSEWLTPQLFRIGASRLAEKIVEILNN